MTQISIIAKEIKNIPSINFELLKEICYKLNKIIRGKREIMYSDIINLIVREGNKGEKYNQLLLWCNYKIRLGKVYLENL